MSVLKLKPACKDYLWGGDRLIKEFHKEYDGKKLAETWELSCHPDGASVIVNGPYKGKTLREYIESCGMEVLGKNCRRFQEFPILIKFIDAKDNLSVQVHPNNSFALKNEGQYGKTEMWYVVDCEEGASLYYGFSKEIDREEFQKRITENTLLEVLNQVPVQKGDVLFIEAGTIHAIGKGILIAEIQQNSNVTYRVYDYGRKDKEGHQRDLHIEKALEVTNRIPLVKSRSMSPHLAKCDYFTVDKLNLDGKLMRQMEGNVLEDSFVNILILKGEGSIVCDGQEVAFCKGDSLFLPAGAGEFRIEGICEALVTTIGEKASPIRVGVYMTSRNVQIGLVDTGDTCLARTEFSIKNIREHEEVIARIAEEITNLLQSQELEIDNCVGIGVGIPGTIDKKRGRVLYSNNIRWKNVSFVKELQKYLPLPVYINNNANCIALGELAAGAAKGCENAVVLTVGNGIGGSVILDGKVFEGRMPGGCELGHMSIQMDGRMCSCGRRGCLEMYTSVPALIRSAKEAMLSDEESLMWERCGKNPDTLTADDIIRAAADHDECAAEVLHYYIRCLCTGITNITNIFRPDRIVLSGEIFSGNREFLEEIDSFIKRKSFGGTEAGVPEVLSAQAGKDAGIIGAAELI